MPDQPTHQATKRFTEERADHPGQTGPAGGAGRPGVTVGELIRPARPAMIVTGLLTAVGALMSIVPFEALRNMAAIWLGETSPEGWRGSLWIWAAIAVGALFASQALYLAGLGITHLAEARLRHHLRRQVIEAISGLPLGRVAQIPHGTIRKMVCDDTTSIHTLVAHVPGDATNAVVMAAAGTAYLLWTDWRLACALVGLWVLALGAMLLTLSGLSGITERFGAAQTALAAATVEMLEGIKEIKGFQATDASRTRFSQARTEFSSLSYEWVSRSGRAISAMTAVLRPSTVFATVAVLAVLFTSQGWTPLSATLPFFLVALGLPEGLMTLIGLMQHMYESRMAAQATADLLSLPPMPEGTRDDGEGPAPGRVDVEDVTFSYEAGSPVLHGVSFTAEPGTVTALVGPSGGGKSTLARLIARFWDVDSGTVLVNGRDVRDQPSRELLSSMSLVFQDVMLSTDTVRANIALGNADATEAEIEEAARAACIHDRIMQLPDGYDTIIGEGAHLSGGEAQRLTIARAFLAASPILILDEATAQADSHSERLIQQAISNLAQKRTVIVIAHRLSTIQSVDQIAVIDTGRLVELGTHDDLLAQDGPYARLWRNQTNITHALEGLRGKEQAC